MTEQTVTVSFRGEWVKIPATRVKSTVAVHTENLNGHVVANLMDYLRYNGYICSSRHNPDGGRGPDSGFGSERVEVTVRAATIEAAKQAIRDGLAWDGQ